MGFLAGFANTLVDQYNKKQDVKNEENKMALQSRLDYLQKQRDSYDTRVTKDKEAQRAAEALASTIGDPDFADVAAPLLRNGMSSESLLKMATDPDSPYYFKKEESKQETTSINVPNPEYVKSRLAKTMETGVDPGPIPVVDSKTPSVPDAVSKPVPGAVEKPVENAQPVTPERVSTSTPLKSRVSKDQDPEASALITEADEKIKKTSPWLFDYEEQQNIEKQIGSNSKYKLVPRAKKWEAEDPQTLIHNLKTAQASGDKGAIASAQSDLQTYSEAKALEQSAKNPDKKYEVAPIKEILYEEDQVKKQLLADPKNPELIAHMEDIQSRKTAALEEEKIKGNSSKDNKNSSFMMLKKDSKGRWSYDVSITGRVDPDGTVHNLSSSKAGTSDDVVTGNMIPITDEQLKRLAAARGSVASEVKEYNNKLTSYTGAVVTGANMMTILEKDPNAGTWTSGVLGDLKSLQTEAAAIVNSIGSQSQSKEMIELTKTIGELDRLSTEAEKAGSPDAVNAVQQEANKLNAQINGILSQGIQDSASNALLFKAYKTSIVYSVAAANDMTGTNFTNSARQGIEEQLKASNPRDFSNRLKGLLYGQKAKLIAQQRLISNNLGPITELERELSYDGQPVNLGVSVPRVDEFILESASQFSSDPIVMSYIQQLAKGAAPTGVIPGQGDQNTQQPNPNIVKQTPGAVGDTKPSKKTGTMWKKSPSGIWEDTHIKIGE